MQQNHYFTKLVANSYSDWWISAGCDYFVDENTLDWFATKPADNLSVSEKPITAHISVPYPETMRVTKHVDTAIWPDNLVDIQKLIAESASLPGTEYGGATATSVGSFQPKLMIISDLPELSDIENKKLGTGAPGMLLERIVAAMGLEISDCYLTALAHSRPASGELSDGDLNFLGSFAKHQIEISGVQNILVLGTAACRALFDVELSAARNNLFYINHNVEKVAAVTTFHPRTMIASPMLKAQAWQDLQMFLKEVKL
jgi:uracil-DNA glycosylase